MDLSRRPERNVVRNGRLRSNVSDAVPSGRDKCPGCRVKASEEGCNRYRVSVVFVVVSRRNIMEGGSPNKKQVKKVLASVFGYNSFREHQEEIVQAILSGRDVFTSMPTGGGKSLCYQIPGLLFDGLTLVISPLIALMKDQVDDALARGIPAAFLNSSLRPEEMSAIYSRLYRNDIKILYLSPERLALEGYLERLREFNVAFFAVDEAHCLSEWGHDFRPDYLVLSRIRRAFPKVPIAAFTATATEAVQKDIIRVLGLREPFTVRASFDRPEICYQVRPKTDVLAQIAAFVVDHPKEPGIVYRFSRKDVEKTAAFLKSRGVRVRSYHAGLPKEKRTRNQELFSNDKIDVLVATTAFGMGINKNNIRYVLHGDLPKSMEGYYQETGRAGRDGLDADCVLFFSAGDSAKQMYFIDKVEDPKEQQKARDNLNHIVRFATVRVCRRKQLLEHFGETHNGNCGNCDVCTGVGGKVDATEDARKILSAIARTNEGFGAGHIIDIVRGADTEKIRVKNHQALPTFGVGKDKTKKWWQAIMDELLGQQMIYKDTECYNVLRMRKAGRSVLFGKEEFFISETTAAKEPAQPVPRHSNRRSGSVDPILFNRLKELRKLLAGEKGVPPYIVFSDKTLSEMAVRKPMNNTEFLSVSGVGEKKLRVYGPVFLKEIRDYVASDNRNGENL